MVTFNSPGELAVELYRRAREPGHTIEERIWLAAAAGVRARQVWDERAGGAADGG